MTNQTIKKYIETLSVDISCSFKSIFEINTFCPLKALKNNSITWVRSLNEEIVNGINSVDNILCFIDLIDIEKAKQLDNYIAVDNPHKIFFMTLEEFFVEKKTPTISKTCVIESSNIGDNISIGNFSVIGKDVVIGDNCVIGNNVTIENHVTIGNNCVIESGARIGVWGFGNYLNDDGTSTTIPHLGGVNIGNNVFIGANTVIARGTLSDTIIKDDVKIDAQCGIAHNTELNERVMVTGKSAIAGSAVVGSDTWLAPGSIINSGVVVGKNCMVGMNSSVTKNIPDNMFVMGSPAKIIKENTDTKYKI